MKYTSVILCAGSGTRTALEYNKNLYKINGKRILDYSLHKFLYDDSCNQIILVVSFDDYDKFNLLYSNQVDMIIIGGNTRQESVKKSLQKVKNKYVLLHDGARPIISDEFLAFISTNIHNYKAFSVGSKVNDTIHIVGNSLVLETIDRNSIASVFTPQVFELELLKHVHQKAEEESFIGTDDLTLVHKFSDIKPYIFFTKQKNIKFTSLEDAKLLEVLLNEDWT